MVCGVVVIKNKCKESEKKIQSVLSSVSLVKILRTIYCLLRRSFKNSQLKFLLLFTSFHNPILINTWLVNLDEIN